MVHVSAWFKNLLFWTHQRNIWIDQFLGNFFVILGIQSFISSCLSYLTIYREVTLLSLMLKIGQCKYFFTSTHMTSVVCLFYALLWLFGFAPSNPYCEQLRIFLVTSFSISMTYNSFER